MPIHDFNAQRLFVEAPLAGGARIPATADQANYLRNVLRLGDGASILVFNGRDGEWRARLSLAGKRGADLVAEQQTRAQDGGPDVHYLFAPLKRSRLDYMVQKATEMGVARLCPVLTRYTVAERVNTDRMRANVVEAAEQCGILRVPVVDAPKKLEAVLADWDPMRRLIFCDEGAEIASPIEALVALLPPPPAPPRVGEVSPSPDAVSVAALVQEALSSSQRQSHSPPPCGEGSGVGGRSTMPVAVLIGPEGGFSPEERALLLSKPYALRVSLGPRIMRADTAAVAALALVNAVLGDWRTQDDASG